METNGWPGFVAQVRERYIAGNLTLEEFQVDLGVAVLLDEGMLPAAEHIPRYLRDRNGFYLVQPDSPR